MFIQESIRQDLMKDLGNINDRSLVPLAGEHHTSYGLTTTAILMTAT